MIKVVFPFDSVTQAQLRKIRPFGKWCSSRKYWEFPLAAGKNLIAQFGNRFVITDELAKWLALLNQPLPSLLPFQYLVAPSELGVALSDGRSPLPHQCQGVCWLLERPRALLADEMGLGKTLTALLAARVITRLFPVQVMVIAPVGLHSHWLQEAKAVGVSIELQSWADLPEELSPLGTLLVVDEAHFAQSIQAKRTKSFLRLTRHPRLQAIWMLTGTPMKNGRPAQLFPLLVALDHPLGKDQPAFEKYFCQGFWRIVGTKQIWDSNGSSNLEELRELLIPFLLSRKKDKLLCLPKKIRKEHLISLPPLAARGFDHRISLVIDEYRYRVKNNLAKAEAESLAVLTAMRQISAEFKLLEVSELLVDLQAKGNSIVLFSNFLRPLELLQSHLGGELLTGRQSLKQREVAVNNFQKGDTSLLLTSFGAGGLGFTLHRAKHVVLLERPWTPGAVEQAEDRCHRLGMDGPLTCHWFKLGFADELIDSLLLNKAENIEILMGSRRLIIKARSLSAMAADYLQNI